MNKYSREDLSKLKFFCACNKSKRSFDLQQIKVHTQSGCGFAEVPCPFNCYNDILPYQTVQEMDLFTHIKECPNRPVTYTRCGVQVKFCEKSTHLICLPNDWMQPEEETVETTLNSQSLHQKQSHKVQVKQKSVHFTHLIGDNVDCPEDLFKLA